MAGGASYDDVADGGDSPAFPHARQKEIPVSSYYYPGISERRFIAMTVMPAIIAKLPYLEGGMDEAAIADRLRLVAASALGQADALIAMDKEIPQ